MKYIINQELKHSLKKISFNHWEYSEQDYVGFIYYFYEELDIIKDLKLDQEVFCRFLETVKKNYRPNPFHNFAHCFTVTHMMFCLILTNQLETHLTPIEKLILLTSAMCHDLDHPGLSNHYQITSQSELAILYNDISVLENHHCAMTFKLLLDKELNINFLSHLNRLEFGKVRKGIISCILATDLSKQGDILKEFRSLDNFLISNNEHRSILLPLLMKAADLSVEIRPNYVASKWVDLLFEEFTNEVNLCKKMNIPFQEHMDLSKTTIAKSQVNFIKFVLMPVYAALGFVLPTVQTEFIPLISQSLESYQKNL